MGQTKGVGNGENGGWLRITIASQDIDDDGGREHALIERFLAGRLDSGKSVQPYTFQDRHHLTITVSHGF
jgi:hypothetical protein